MDVEEIADVLADVHQGDELRVTDDTGLTVDVHIQQVGSDTDPDRSTDRVYYEIYFTVDIDESPAHDTGLIDMIGEGWDWETATITYHDGVNGITQDIEELEVVE